MAASPKFRPARRMSPERHAALCIANQARRDKHAQQLEPTPIWESVPRLTALPGGLYWSGQEPVPAVGQQIQVVREGLQGGAQVTGYFHVDGFLGVVARFDKVPARFQKAPRSNCVFGRQLVQAA